MLNGQPYYEHHNELLGEASTFAEKRIYFKNKRGTESICLSIDNENQRQRLTLSYYIGLDWIDEKNSIYVAPKLNKDSGETDYLSMLYTCMQHPDVLGEMESLYHIQFDKPYIEIEQKKDMLTPFLVIQFLQVVRVIVKKGLKKSYYPVEENLNAKVKGKVVVNKNFRLNTLKNQKLKVVCAFSEFGVDSLENRLLKKALGFVRKYLMFNPSISKGAMHLLNYCTPAFEKVSDRVELSEIKSGVVSLLFKEYTEGLKLAKLILRRFGYNISTIQKEDKIKLPPFWIDMSRLYELYVLGKLKDRFGNQVDYQFTRRWNELDYLLKSPQYKMIIDAKYKLRYNHTYDIKDIRQLSGYARLSAVSKELSKEENEVIDCLIVYPDQASDEKIPTDLKAHKIDGFNHFYKVPIKLPIITSSQHIIKFE